MILYEYPFNERIRTYLRLECLFSRLGQLLASETALGHHFALATLFDIIDASNRADLKSEILKELERQKQQLASYRGNPAVSEASLNTILERLEKAYAALVNQRSKAGEDLVKNDWLMSIRSRMAIPGGTCAFDLPSYHTWQTRQASVRKADLDRWTASFATLAQAVSLLLQILRDTGKRQMHTAAGGQFQMNLPHGRDIQLLRLRIDPSLNLVPEISGNRFMLSVRLTRQSTVGQPEPVTTDTPIELALCA